jgi:hypothetical protein
MTIQRAITVLKEYNEWRRHEGEPCPHPYSAQEIGVAIDVAVHCLWKVKKMIEIIDFGNGQIDS